MKALFTGKKTHIPKRSIEKWGADEIKRWTSNTGLAAYNDVLACKGGQGLLELTQLDIYEMARSKSDAARLLDELYALHSREGTGVNLMSVTPSSAGDSRPITPGSSQEAMPAGGNSTRFDSLAAHFGELGISGQGLETAAQGMPLVGPVIGSLWDLHTAAVGAKGFRRSCLELDAYLKNILRVFDAEGRRLAAASGASLRRLLEVVDKAKALVEPCCLPGWLGLMIAEERVDMFAAVHNAMLQVLKDEHLDVLPNGSHLCFGNYQEESRPLRRLLKQAGGGSIEGGLLAVQQEKNAMAELVDMLDIDAKVLLLEIQTSRVTPDMASDAMALVAISAPSKPGAKDSSPDIQADGAVKQQQAVETTNGLEPAAEKDLLKAFCSFASFGAREHTEEMDGAKFAKLCRDSKLLSRTVTASDADLFFAKVKTKGARKINFQQFVDALSLIAAKKGISLGEAADTVVAANGPCVSGTKADYVKFHDDKSTYTGVYKKGGPTCVEPGKRLSDLVDRSQANAMASRRASLGVSPLQAAPNGNSATNGRKPAPIVTSLVPTYSGSGLESPNACWGVTSPPSLDSASAQTSRRRSTIPVATPDSAGSGPQGAWDVGCDDELLAAFRAFASFGSGTPKSGTPKSAELDGKGFVKLCRDSHLLDSRLTTTAIDLIFSRVRGQGARKIDFAAFQKALPLLAAEKGCRAEDVRRSIVLSEGPRRNSSMTPDFVRLHDDKTTFTGVYAKGGPSTVDKRITAATITDRSAGSRDSA
ncbi:hypothetical protein CVIRNUC_006936 [Coccomyxa viridis]|uniref:P25-alpha family protein n=1 Tax=Coccomyxa viridis TaxID=1274662 RepID=A0AAV1I9G2_9CHLO|nr:hypothetical protein CVIRNUC_006936 [Coccomyxa viridis]